MKIVLAGFSLWLAGPAWAQDVWRCPQGASTVYQAEPCVGGRAVAASPPLPAREQAEAQAQARALALREQALAAQLRAERLQRERAAMAKAAGFANPRTELSQSSKPQLGPVHRALGPRLDADARTSRTKRLSSRRNPD